LAGRGGDWQGQGGGGTAHLDGIDGGVDDPGDEGGALLGEPQGVASDEGKEVVAPGADHRRMADVRSCRKKRRGQKAERGRRE